MKRPSFVIVITNNFWRLGMNQQSRVGNLANNKEFQMCVKTGLGNSGERLLK